jgi:hypothetical protein
MGMLRRRVGDAGWRGEGRKFDQRTRNGKREMWGPPLELFPKHEPAYGWGRATEGGSQEPRSEGEEVFSAWQPRPGTFLTILRPIFDRQDCPASLQVTCTLVAACRCLLLVICNLCIVTVHTNDAGIPASLMIRPTHVSVNDSLTPTRYPVWTGSCRRPRLPHRVEAVRSFDHCMFQTIGQAPSKLRPSTRQS